MKYLVLSCSVGLGLMSFVPPAKVHGHQIGSSRSFQESQMKAEAENRVRKLAPGIVICKGIGKSHARQTALTKTFFSPEATFSLLLCSLNWQLSV